MALEAIEQVKQNLKNLEPRMKDVRSMIQVLKSAGEDTTQVENTYRELERRKIKWENALKQAGY